MRRFGNVWRGLGKLAVGLVARQQAVKQAVGQLLASKFASGVNGIHISHFADLGQISLARQREHFRDHGLIQLLVRQYGAQRGNQTLIHDQWLTLLMLTDQFLQHLNRQLLARIPAVEAVAVVLHQKHQLVAVVREAQPDRCREATQQGRQWFISDIDEGKRLLGLSHRKHPRAAGCGGFVGQTQGDLAAFAVQQAQLDRNHERLFLITRLARCGRAALAEGQAVGFRSSIIRLADRQTRRACLAVPALELGQVNAIGVFHGLDEIVAGHCLTIVAFEIQVAAFTEALSTQQGMEHADDFRTLFVHGQGVEVGDFDKAVRAHGMGHRAGIFGKLVGAQVGNVLNTLDRGRVHVGREPGVAIHREAFLERQLEPVTAGHAVARPVVEVFVGDDRFDALVRGIGSRFGAGQHGAGVEDIEALVLHRAHVEVVDRDDHEDIQVVLATVGLFIPAHGFFQAGHGVLALVDVFRLDVDAQGHFPLAHGGEGVFDAPQIAGHQREQVSRFHERVFPGRPVPSALFFAAGNRVAVGQQDREVLLVGAERGSEFAHHVGAVEVVGNLAKALGLTLGAEHAAGLVQAFQRGIGFRMDAHGAVDRETFGLWMQRQVIVCQLIISSAELDVTQFHRNQFQVLTVQHQWRQACATLRVAAHDQLGVDQRVVVEQLKGQVRLINEVLGSLVVLEVNHFRLFGAHAGILLLMHGQMIGRVFANVDHAGIENQVLALDPQQRALGNRVLVQVEADNLGRIRLDRVTKLDRLGVM
ncbi:Thiol-disulfide isomerase or thioredoxin [Pseudomonas syringae pv. actinidiae]|uniref:Thiol-disulfide isomerase or thioredoxin n=1 Tax=Pseudomonas syringae pv. actinidiae TaxID=103796 RepID=A0A2V0Q7T5_PSESF|nr:Thiol-disulfide isomerase or thioredoxin [Pseudomonas syringae pv. actinidiae]